MTFSFRCFRARLRIKDINTSKPLWAFGIQVFIQENVYENMIWKMAAIFKWIFLNESFVSWFISYWNLFVMIKGQKLVFGSGYNGSVPNSRQAITQTKDPRKQISVKFESQSKSFQNDYHLTDRIFKYPVCHQGSARLKKVSLLICTGIIHGNPLGPQWLHNIRDTLTASAIMEI